MSADTCTETGTKDDTRPLSEVSVAQMMDEGILSIWKLLRKTYTQQGTLYEQDLNRITTFLKALVIHELRTGDDIDRLAFIDRVISRLLPPELWESCRSYREKWMDLSNLLSMRCLELEEKNPDRLLKEPFIGEMLDYISAHPRCNRHAIVQDLNRPLAEVTRTLLRMEGHGLVVVRRSLRSETSKEAIHIPS